MKISSKSRKNINRFLFVASFLVVISAVWATLVIVGEISNNEHYKIKVWELSVQRKAELIEQSQNFFVQIEAAERSKLQLWADAVTKMSVVKTPAEFDFYREIVEENTTIPVVVTDQNFKILHCANTDIDRLKITYLEDTLLEKFSKNPPLSIPFMGETWYFHYKHPKAFIELQEILDGVIHSFMDEIMVSSIFYEDSKTVELLAYLPIIAFIIFGIFIGSIIWGMRVAKQSENNKLWVGMSRETAHQLGTPLSSLKGWMEYLKNQNVDENHLMEIEKDIDRLSVISERFSKIGSEPKMKTENIVQIVYKSISYLQPRLSKKIKLHVNIPQTAVVLAGINSQLVEWVLENLVGNAADAIETKDGLIEINIIEHSHTVTIDVTDNGKGIPKNQWKQTFVPGYTTKSRGWGLGLPLCYRIVTNYHKGEIFVKHSTVGEGTTIRIILNK
jgi:hypothetical protein